MPGVSFCRVISQSVLSQSRESSAYLIGLFGDSNVRPDHRFSDPVVERRGVNCPAWPGVDDRDTFDSGSTVSNRHGYCRCCHTREIAES